jgi:hypothetical protein
MQLLSLTISTLFIAFIHAFHYRGTMTEDRRLSPSEAEAACDPSEYRLWYNTTVPSDFPLPLSKDISAYLYAPDCAARYGGADTWFVSWAADDLLYSAFTDGTVNNITSISDGGHPLANTTTGHAMLNGSDPLNLTILSPGIFRSNTGPYSGRYPSANLHYNGVWYQSTYGASDNYGPCANWCIQGPFLSFRYSVDQGKTWYEYNMHPTNDTDNLFNQTSANRQKVKYGGLHFVDHGKNQEWSPDGYVYLIGHGSNSSFPASPNTTFPVESWNEGDQVYLCRIRASIQSVNDANQFEFWNGIEYIRGKDGVDKAQALFTFPNKTGTATASYVPALKKYLMVVSTASYPGVGSMRKEYDIYILESNRLEGPWSLVQYLNKFGPEAYFPIVPTKFLGQSHDIKVLSDGSALWPFYFGYSANWAYHGTPNPPHSGYSFCLLSSKLVLTSNFTNRLIQKEIIQQPTFIHK